MNEEIGLRLRQLRDGLGISQAKIGKMIGIGQTAVNRYENGDSATPIKILVWYADYFDVSLDYLCGRTEKPQGKLYKFRPKVYEERADMKEFVEMCFNPNSPMNERLKQTLVSMLEEVQNEQ